MLMSKNPKVSVIIPVYGVERFIERCSRSLMEQTLDDIEYIFVDDASKDKSIELLNNILDFYPKRKECVSIITHEFNAGLPAARNTGLKYAKGEYVFHCDSDDFLELNALELLYNAAKNYDADIVWCDWFLTFEKNERHMTEPSFTNPLLALKAMLGGGMKYNVWNKLVRRRLYVDNDIEFPAGHGMGEDMTMMLLFAYAEKVCHIDYALYHYVKMNTSSFTHTISQVNFDSVKYNVERVSKKIISLFGEQFESELAFLKLEAKFPLLVMSSDFSFYRLWNEWYPEANSFIMKNKNVSLRSRIVQCCARYHLYWIVWLHYQIVCRFVYGFIYK